MSGDSIPNMKSVNLIVFLWSSLGMLSYHRESQWTRGRLRLYESGPFQLNYERCKHFSI
jgi:hypothetical protein